MKKKTTEDIKAAFNKAKSKFYKDAQERLAYLVTKIIGDGDAVCLDISALSEEPNDEVRVSVPLFGTEYDEEPETVRKPLLYLWDNGKGVDVGRKDNCNGVSLSSLAVNDVTRILELAEYIFDQVTNGGYLAVKPSKRCNYVSVYYK